jgi:hypothetical protein
MPCPRQIESLQKIPAFREPFWQTPAKLHCHQIQHKDRPNQAGDPRQRGCQSKIAKELDNRSKKQKHGVEHT